MVALIFFVLSLVASPFKPKSRLEAENAALRHQMMVLQRKVRGRGPLHQRRSPILYPALSLVPVGSQGHDNPAAGDRRALASRWTSPLLALEIRMRGRPAANRCGIAGVDLADERGQSALGCTAHSWRTTQARLCGGAVERRQVQGQEGRSVWSELGHVPAQSCAAYRGHGFVRGADHRLYPALRSGHCPAGSARACLVQCNRAPDGGMDRAATDGSFPLE